MYYSPILFSKIADLTLINSDDKIHGKIDIEKLNNKDNIIIFCLHSYGILIKLEPFLYSIKKPFILISAMEDTEFPLEINNSFINNVTNNKYFKHWFTINKTIPNNNYFTSIPYGLDYWTLLKQNYFGEKMKSIECQNTDLENIARNSNHFINRIHKIYANFHLHLTDERHGNWRRKLQNIIPKNIIYYQPTYLPRSQSYTNMSKYSFVISPFGHGYDCIRTFEALCLGCIVIMKKSFLDIIYEGLPVLIVNDWRDINEELLENTLNEFKSKEFNYDKLKMDYWINLVLSKF